MKNLLKWYLVTVLALLFVVGLAYTVDRLLLAPPCPRCHTDITKNLPLFSPATAEGLMRIRANGMEFRARLAGFNNRDGDGVILLHGFPETSIMWEPLLKQLAEGGFRAVAFDQRGYSPGARPFSVHSYTTDKLATDVIAVARAVGFNRFHIVGQDWGSVIAWTAANRYPQRVASVTSLSMPHPDAYSEALNYRYDQLLRSSYVALYWLPMLPEVILGFNRAAYLQHSYWQLATPGQLNEYKQVFSEPGALRGALNWYRAFSFLPRQPIGKTKQPTLFIWGNQDRPFGRVAAEMTPDHVEGPIRFIELTAGHSLMSEVPEKVVKEILSHLRAWTIRNNKQKQPESVQNPDEQGWLCGLSKPPCFRIMVHGKAVRIFNRCHERYKGAIRVRCPGWSAGAYVDYRFDLGPDADLVLKSHGLVFGSCYYNQQVCAARNDTGDTAPTPEYKVSAPAP